MDHDTLRNRVWEEMLLAEMRSNYFAELVSQYQRREKWIRLLTLVASSAAAATVLSVAPSFVKLGLPIAAAVASSWLLLSNYGSLALDASNLHESWNAKHTEYERLWNDLDAPDAGNRLGEIFSSANPLSKAGTKFPNKTKRLEFWLDHAATLAQSRYA